MPDEFVDGSWRQGSIIESAQLREHVADCTIADEDLAIVITQDCDLICDSFEDEPRVEILIAHSLDIEVDGNLTHGKNPRIIDFIRETDDSQHPYRCRIREKLDIDRRILLDRRPVDKLDERLTDVLKRWVAKRYVRAALPTEFNNRVKGAMPAIKRILEVDGVVLTAIYLSLDWEDELASNEIYRLAMFTTVLPETKADAVAFARATQATSRLHEALNACSGIELKESMVYGEQDITLHDRRYLILWDTFDYLSIRNSGTLPAT